MQDVDKEKYFCYTIGSSRKLNIGKSNIFVSGVDKKRYICYNTDSTLKLNTESYQLINNIKMKGV